MTTTTSTPPATAVAAYASAPRFAGLDGLRALAVGLVVVYHLFPSFVFHQGFVGVDVFFVISGFLITSLLLRETDAAGRIAYADFWRRRARRLLPALITLIAACGLWAWLVGGDVLVALGRQVLGALTFSYNWVSIAGGDSYFAASNPELFRNLWSLAVEEQFYVLWPVLLPLLLLVRVRAVKVVVAVLTAAASAIWMGVLVASGGDLTRAYFGTDSHGFGILLGVALAFGLHRAPGTARPPLRGADRVFPLLGGLLAVAGILAIAVLPETSGIATFPGALAAVSVLTVAAIAAAVHGGSLLGRALDIAPLRWIGVRSYGIYLWHWPVLVLLMAGLTGAGAGTDVPLWIGGVALVVTLVASTLSYRFIEQPIRRIGFRGTFRALWSALRGGARARLAAVGAVLALAMAATATTAAIASAPAQTSAESVVAEGAEALAEASETPEATALPTATPTPSPVGPVEPIPGYDPSPQPTPVVGTEISAVGDSVMLASAKGLLDRFPGIQIDAAVSRSMWAGPSIIEHLAEIDRLRPYVVVALGTNGPVDPESLERIVEIIGPDRSLILVNASAPRDWIPGVNETLKEFAASHPNVKVADWAAAIDTHPDQLAGDRIHPGSTGGKTYADTVAATVQSIEDTRALHEFQRDQALRRFMDLSR